MKPKPLVWTSFASIARWNVFAIVLSAALVSCAGDEDAANPANSAQQAFSAVNTIKSINPVAATVEIEVHSTKPFPVRALPPVLKIGDKRFRMSRPPKDGSLHTLVFSLNASEFAQLHDGDPVVVLYGAAESPGERWNFGRLDKSRMAQ